jgi:cell wall-associated NlpC family hydrolase
MGILGKAALALLLCPFAHHAAQAQDISDSPRPSKIATATVPSPEKAHSKKSVRALSSDDRLAVLASALDSKTPRFTEHDCSHLVHAIYERAGFPYNYASSDDLYDGVGKFQRVSQPQPGDLVVWHGHVGIVVRPSKHVFYSFLHAGPGIDDYNNHYWTNRGEPRFYRYVKN